MNKKGGGGPSMKYCKHFVGVANFGVVCSEDRRMAHSFNLFDNKYGLANDAWVSIVLNHILDDTFRRNNQKVFTCTNKG